MTQRHLQASQMAVAPERKWPPVGELVPHQPPMSLLDEVLDFQNDCMTCAVTVRADAPFVEPEGVQAVVTLEYMAQCVAAWAGLSGRLQGQRVRIGFLIGCRDMHLHRKRIPIGAQLVVTSQRVWGDSVLGSFECEVRDADGCVATALLTTAQAGPDGALPEPA